MLSNYLRSGKTLAFYFIIFSFVLPCHLFGQTTDSSKVVIADIVTIHSKILGQDRKIYIYSPSINPGLYPVSQPLPVLYLLDGDVQTSFVASEVNFLSQYNTALPAMIVVGIGNFNYDRMHDLTPHHASMSYGVIDTAKTPPQNNTGGGDKFLQFIKEEVMPYVEQHYKTVPYKVLSGHSLGGLTTVHCLLTQPDLFNAYIAVSPSLWYDMQYEITKNVKQLKTGVFKNKSLFFSDGAEGGYFHQSVLHLDSILKERNSPGLTYKYMMYPDMPHDYEPVKAEYDALRFVFSPFQPPSDLNTAEMIIAFYKQLSSRFGYSVIPPEGLVNSTAYQVMQEPGKVNEAIALFQLNVSNYPSSPNAYDGLGDGYASAGNAEKAKACYKKELELDPNNEAAKAKIK